MSSDTETFTDVLCVAETERAIRVQFDNDPTTQKWIPKSVVHDDGEVYGQGHQGKLVVMQWFAEKEGLS